MWGSRKSFQSSDPYPLLYTRLASDGGGFSELKWQISLWTMNGKSWRYYTFERTRSLCLSKLRYLSENARGFFLGHVSFDMNLIVRLGDQLILELVELVNELLKKPECFIMKRSRIYMLPKIRSQNISSEFESFWKRIIIVDEKSSAKLRANSKRIAYHCP